MWAAAPETEDRYTVSHMVTPWQRPCSLRRFRRRFPPILSNPPFSPPVISPPLSPSFSPPFSQPLPLFKIREETLARVLSEASHFKNLTGLSCEYIEDLERPHCVVTKELTSFWEMLGVHVEAEPSTQGIIAAFERCEGGSQDDRKRRKRLAYLAIFTGYIEGRKYSTPTRGRDISGCYTINGFAQALQVWVYTALLEFGVTYGNPLPNNPSPPILAYKG
uniref:Uncharacterized protein n=1 Tax=Brassica oleracea var. oleracea TaxID=109376 RepID=A0A0D3DJJ9_BRAOL